MKILNPNKTRQLRAMIAKALDKASTDAEKQGSALGACRLLAEFGLGVESESIDPEKTESVALLMPDEIVSNEDRVFKIYSSDISDMFETLFGRPQRRRPAQTEDPQATSNEPPWEARYPRRRSAHSPHCDDSPSKPFPSQEQMFGSTKFGRRR